MPFAGRAEAAFLAFGAFFVSLSVREARRVLHKVCNALVRCIAESLPAIARLNAVPKLIGDGFGIIDNMRTSIFDWMTLVIAVAGFVLGVINYVTELFRRRPRARVTVRNYVSSAGDEGLAVSVVNAGETTFTVRQVAFKLRNGFVLVPFAAFGYEFPKVLKPGEECQLMIPRRCYLDAGRRNIKCVIAEIATGKVFRSKKLTDKFLGVS